MNLRGTISKSGTYACRRRTRKSKDQHIMVYMNNATGIGEHSDIVEAIQEELDKMAGASDRIEMLEKYFSA